MIRGTEAPSVASEQDASRWVRDMFGRIAPRYDFLNHFLSLNIDRMWRARLIRRVEPILRNPQARVLDLCCGTGDVMLRMSAIAKARVYGSDFCHEMMTAARAKALRKGITPLLIEADGLAMPLQDHSMDLITIAFGFRNLASYRQGLEEILRLLRPGGTVAILEFAPPPKTWWGKVHSLYCRKILPKIGGLISGSREAYEYLPASISKFPSPHEFAEEMRAAGFSVVRYELMNGGLVSLHMGAAPQYRVSFCRPCGSNQDEARHGAQLQSG